MSRRSGPFELPPAVNVRPQLSESYARARPSVTGKVKDYTPDQRVIKALSHPLRFRILAVLNQKVASPSEIAEELDEPLGHVAYHTKILAENGAIEQVRTAPVRGALEHFYRAQIRPWFDDELSAQPPNSVRRALFGEILQYIWSDVVAASEHGGFDDPRTHITRTHLDLDEEAYRELADLLNSVVDRALELHSEGAPRLAELSPEERQRRTRRTALAIMHFDRARGSDEGGGAPAGTT
jgi:DNA-binding transcriptional ArsR family regulator